MSAQITEQTDLAGVDLVTVLQALSDPVRLEIVRQLACDPAGRCRAVRSSSRSRSPPRAVA